ncbi:MAG: PepSY-associated TM helix domain-containing protein [Edaphobacter sp.]
MLTAKKVRLWYRVHKWTSLICTAFLLMSCMTGLPLIFEKEISHLTEHHIRAAVLPDRAPLANLDDMVASARLRYPKQQILALAWDVDEPRVFVFVAPGYRSNTSHRLAFDAHTGRFLDEPKPDHNFMDYITALHVEMFAGLPGELFLGCMAGLFIISLASGVLVYGPFMRRLEFGTIRKNAHRRLRWFDLHNLIGIVTLSWAVVVGTTGIMNTLSRPLFGLWRSHELAQLIASNRAGLSPDYSNSVQAAVRAALSALPDMQIDSVLFPGNKLSTSHHYLIWMRGKAPVTSRLFTPVLGRCSDRATYNCKRAALVSSHSRSLASAALRRLRRDAAQDHLGDFRCCAHCGATQWQLSLALSPQKRPSKLELDRLVKVEELAARETPAGALAR